MSKCFPVLSFAGMSCTKPQLIPADESTIAATLAPDQLGKIGSVRVTVYRAKQNKRAIPRIYEGKMPQVLDEISEKSLKGRAIDNNIK